MGIFWSCCEDNEDVCRGCSRRGLQLTNDECQFCRNRPRVANNTGPRYVPRSKSAYRPHAKIARPGPAFVIPKIEKRRRLFGYYRCTCGRTWESRRSWKQKTQTCKICDKEVYAYKQRELRPEDMEERSRKNGMLDHREDLCEMCRELGYYCGKYKS